MEMLWYNSCRSFDGAKVQIDFILIDGRGELVTTWCDFILPIGLDHRCVHCNIRFTIPTLGKEHKQRSLKGWRPFLDETGVPKKFHDVISEQYNAHDEELLRIWRVYWHKLHRQVALLMVLR